MTDAEVLRGIMACFPDAITVSDHGIVYENGKPIEPERLRHLGAFLIGVLHKAREQCGSWTEMNHRKG